MPQQEKYEKINMGLVLDLRPQNERASGFEGCKV
jgi:hypothetical protein